MAEGGPTASPRGTRQSGRDGVVILACECVVHLLFWYSFRWERKKLVVPGPGVGVIPDQTGFQVRWAELGPAGNLSEACAVPL